MDAFRVQRYGMPYSGGWMEQPAGFLDRCETLMAVYETIKEWRNAKSWQTYAQQHPEKIKLVQKVLRLRYG